MGKKFELGRLVITSNAADKLDDDDVKKSLLRHTNCDWGEVRSEDWKDNDSALDEYCQLFSVYYDSRGVKFWIITEADRSVTTVLLPEDY